MNILFCAVVNKLLGDSHRTEVGTTHGAEVVIVLVALYVVLTCAGWIERQVELVFPAEFEAGLAHGVIADLCAGMSFGKVGGMGCDLVGDHTVAHIFEVGECEMFLGVT